MNAVTIIFPHQLYEQHPAIASNRKIYLIEEWLFFRQFRFHKLKLVLHRASMKSYHQLLIDGGYQVEYIQSSDERSDIRKLLSWVAGISTEEIHYVDTVDNWAEMFKSKKKDRN